MGEIELVRFQYWPGEEKRPWIGVMRFCSLSTAVWGDANRGEDWVNTKGDWGDAERFRRASAARREVNGWGRSRSMGENGVNC